MSCNGHGKAEQVAIWDVSDNRTVTVFYVEAFKPVQNLAPERLVGGIQRKIVEDSIALNLEAGCPAPSLILMVRILLKVTNKFNKLISFHI